MRHISHQHIVQQGILTRQESLANVQPIAFAQSHKNEMFGGHYCHILPFHAICRIVINIIYPPVPPQVAVVIGPITFLIRQVVGRKTCIYVRRINYLFAMPVAFVLI